MSGDGRVLFDLCVWGCRPLDMERSGDKEVVVQELVSK